MTTKFQSLEAGRGVAALLVVLYHASSKVFAAPKYWNTHVFGGFFDFGHAGVAFFFVLSGFIVAHMHARDIGHRERLMKYVRNRVLRIYPVYWLVLAVVLATTAAGFNARVALSPALVASSFALVGNDAHSTVLAVAWTLYHEIAYYFVFGVFIFAPRLGLALAAVWLAGIAAAAIGDGFLPIYLGNSINLLFPIGIATWWVSIHRGGHIPIAVAWLGAMAFLAVGMDEVFAPTFAEPVRNLLFGLCSAVTIAGLVARERRRAIEISPILAVLGTASFSIYLIHFPLLGFLARIHGIAAVRALPDGLVFVVLVAAVTFAGIVFRQLVEKPLLKWTHREWTRLAGRDGEADTGRPELRPR